MKFEVEHPFVALKNFETQGFTQIVGCDIKQKYFLSQLISWTFTNHKYSQFETDYLQNQIPCLKYNGKRLSKSDWLYIKITNRSELEQQFSLTKGTLLYQCLTMAHNNPLIEQRLMQVNKELKHLEKIMNNHLEDLQLHFKYDFKQLLIQDVLDSVSIIYPEYNDEILVLPFVESKILFLELIQLLNNNSSKIPTSYFIHVENLEHLLAPHEAQEILEMLHEFSEQQNAQIINFITSNEMLYITEKTVSSTVILADNRTEQLTEIELLSQSISRHYPSEYKESSQQLLIRLKRIVPYLLANDGICYIEDDRDKIIYIIINKLLGYDLTRKVEKKELNKLETNFLKHYIY